MRLIRNPFNEMEVKKILKYMVPICENVKQYAWYQNDLKKTIVEAPKWKNKLNKDALLKRYNRKYPLDTNDSSNIFNIGPDIFNPNKFIKIRRILEHNYNARVILRGSFYYPPTGYMGWHTNCAAPGERFYMTWASEDKKSFFRYYDHEKDEIITDYDDKGLTVRQFKVTEAEPYFWHCVGSECDRFSYGFLVQSSVALDFDIYQTLIDKMEHKDISDYVSKLVLDANNK